MSDDNSDWTKVISGGLGTGLLSLIVLTVYFHKINDKDCDPHIADYIEDRLYLGFGFVGSLFMLIVVGNIMYFAPKVPMILMCGLLYMCFLGIFSAMFWMTTILWNRFDEQYLCHEYADGLFHFLVVFDYISLIFGSVLLIPFTIIGCYIIFSADTVRGGPHSTEMKV